MVLVYTVSSYILTEPAPGAVSLHLRPQMPVAPGPEPVTPPPEIEDNWPLQAHGEALELPDAGGSSIVQ